MSEIDSQSQQEYRSYWERRLEQANRAKEYAERMLAAIAIKNTETTGAKD